MSGRFTASEAFSTAPGKRPLDAVWRASVKAAVARQRGSVTVAVFGDISKCFEGVVWGMVRRNALHLDYPGAILRLSLAAYAWPRYITLANATAQPLCASRGIGAGSTFAVHELMAMMLVDLLGLQESQTVGFVCLKDSPSSCFKYFVCKFNAPRFLYPRDLKLYIGKFIIYVLPINNT